MTEVKTKLMENKKKGMPKRQIPQDYMLCNVTFLNVML